MGSPSALPLRYGEQNSPWWRILKFVGIFTLIFGASHLAMGLHFFKYQWEFRHRPNPTMTPRYFWLMSSSSVLNILSGSFLMLGGVQLLRNGSYKIARFGLWLIVAFWGLGGAIGPFFAPFSWTLPGWFDHVFHLMTFFAFPVMAILLLRLHKLKEASGGLDLSNSDVRSPWPQILKIVAVVALVFAIGHLWVSVRGLLRTLNPPALPRGANPWANPPWNIFRATQAVLMILGAPVSLLMIAGSAIYLRRGYGTKALLVGAKLFLLLWILMVLTNIVFRRAAALEYLVDNAMTIVFPLIVLFLLQEYLMPNPQSAPLLVTPLPAPH
jgi:hypothetical protein